MIYPLVAAKMAHIHLQITKYKTNSAVDEHKSVLWDKIDSFIALSSDTCEVNQVNSIINKGFQSIKLNPIKLIGKNY